MSSCTGWMGCTWLVGLVGAKCGDANGFDLLCVRAPLPSPPQENFGFPRPKEKSIYLCYITFAA